VDWLLKGIRATGVLVAAAMLAACTGKLGTSTEGASDGGQTTGTGAETLSGTGETYTASTVTTDATGASSEPTAGGSTGGSGDGCPEPEYLWLGLGAFPTDQHDLPPAGPWSLECEATGYWATWGADSRVRLLCTDPGVAGPPFIEVSVAWRQPDVIDEEMMALVGEVGLQLVFSPSTEFVLRDAASDLIALDVRKSLVDAGEQVGTEVLMEPPFGVEPVSEDGTPWNTPFGDVYARDVGCTERPARRPYASAPGLTTEVPWVLDFESDTGPQTVHDRTTAVVSVSGQSFKVTGYGYVGDRTDEPELLQGRAGFVAVRTQSAPGP
jgi:hypothetical protein